ncbi:MAG: low specificity L-threonine aldolase [Gammaproteobacteria bacterium]|jgi:threonine aldolase|nr:low specificity L-threonine aldolase [Gammaproteobacteria bacterium]
MKYNFASDNTASVAPEAWAAMASANSGYEPGYGEDSWTAKASDLIRELFETDCEVFFTFNGTAANSLALASMCQSYHSIICHEMAHIETDECGAPEFYSNGTKVLLAGGDNGKIDLNAVKDIAQRRSDVHFPKSKVISVTQPTEMGTVYTTDDLEAIGELAKSLSLRLHMDGARFFNALASLDVTAKEISWQCGVDVLCLGGTKLGMPVGDAVVFFNKELAYEFEYRCKQAGQLASKMRFLSAPWVGMLENKTYLKHARHANNCAQSLAEQLSQFSEIKLVAPVEANGVFAHFPDHVHKSLKDKGWRYYNFIAKGGARLMCSWNTNEQDITDFINDIRSSL